MLKKYQKQLGEMGIYYSAIIDDEESINVGIDSIKADAIHETDLGNARRLVKLHGQDLRYCHLWDK